MSQLRQNHCNIHHIYLSNKKCIFFVDYLDHSAIIFSKNDDYLKVEVGYITNISLGMSYITIVEIEIERLGNFEIK